MIVSERRAIHHFPYMCWILAFIPLTIYVYIAYYIHIDPIALKYTHTHHQLSTYDLIQWGGNCYLKTTQGEWWRLVLAPFLHANLSHLISNVLVLLIIAYYIERLIGALNILILFLGSCVLSGICSIFYYDLHVVVGASGGIYGLIGGGITYFRLIHAKRVKDVHYQVILLSLFLLYTLWLNVSHPQVDHMSHWSGLLVGILLGIPITYTRMYQESYLSLLVEIPAWRTLSVCMVIACSAIGLRYLPEPSQLSHFLKWLDQQETQIKQIPLQRMSYKQQRWYWLNQIDPALHQAEEKLKKLKDAKALTHKHMRMINDLKTLVQTERQYFTHLYLNLQPTHRLQKAKAQYYRWLQQVYRETLHQAPQTSPQPIDVHQAHIQLMLRSDLWSLNQEALLTFALQVLEFTYQNPDVLHTQHTLYVRLAQQNINYLLEKHADLLQELSLTELLVYKCAMITLVLYQKEFHLTHWPLLLV